MFSKFDREPLDPTPVRRSRPLEETGGYPEARCHFDAGEASEWALACTANWTIPRLCHGTPMAMITRILARVRTGHPAFVLAVILMIHTVL